MNLSVSSSELTKRKAATETKLLKPVTEKASRTLLFCGILSSLLYILMNILCALFYKGYNSSSQAVSELSAIGAPTRSLWVSLAIVYSFLLMAFAWGIWQSANENKLLKVVAILFFANAAIGFFWPPMHQRQVLAAGGGSMTDMLHIAFTAVWGLFAMLIIGFGIAALGKGFRLYSIVTIVLLITFGVITGLEGPKLNTNLPTPWIGVWERINIGVFMLWVAVLATLLLNRRKVQLT